MCVGGGGGGRRKGGWVGVLFCQMSEQRSRASFTSMCGFLLFLLVYENALGRGCKQRWRILCTGTSAEGPQDATNHDRDRTKTHGLTVCHKTSQRDTKPRCNKCQSTTRWKLPASLSSTALGTCFVSKSATFSSVFNLDRSCSTVEPTSSAPSSVSLCALVQPVA